MPELTEHPLIILASLISGLTALISAIVSWRASIKKENREDRKDHRDANKQLADMEDQVRQDTSQLYQELTRQYRSINDRDRKFLRKITTVVRKLMVMERMIDDTFNELETRWEIHSSEAESINCPFFSEINEFFYDQISSIQRQIYDTMEEVDSILLNGANE